MTMQTEIERIAANLVRNEVHCCLSYVVATLARGYGAPIGGGLGNTRDLADLAEQAFELCAPLDDWEEAAIQAGAKITLRDDEWIVLDQNDKPELWNTAFKTLADAARAYCDSYSLDPYQCEIFEHWAVSQRLAEDLASLGERVDTDFAGLCVWGRTTTGQMIQMDSVIQRVAQLVHDRAKAISEEVA